MDTNGKTTTWMESAAGRQLQERLNDEQTLTSLDHLLQRIQTLEEAVEKLTTLLERGPGLVSMAADISDETYRRMEKQGIHIEERLTNALHLAERLTAPETVAKIDQLLENAALAPEMASMIRNVFQDLLEQIPPQGLQLEQRTKAIATLAGRLTDPGRVEQLNQLLDALDMAPDLIGAMSGTLQDIMQQIPPEGLRLDERIKGLLPLLDKLTQPETTARLHELIGLTEMAPDMAKTVSGIAADVLQQMPEGGLRLDERVQAVLPLLDRLTDPATTEKLQTLIDLADRMPNFVAMGADIADEQMEKALECGFDLNTILHLFASSGQAFCEAAREDYKPMGLMGMMTAPMDKDRQVAIGFLMSFLKKFGQRMVLRP